MKSLKYVVDYAGKLFGSFETKKEAADWANVNCGDTWAMRPLSVPPKGEESGR